MPRRRKDLPDISLRSTFVARMTEEQQLRGWSDAGLAARASKLYPVGASTIWKMKNADPPRRVDLDEADAIGQAFGFTDAMEFVKSSRRDQFLRSLTFITRSLETIKNTHRGLTEMMESVTSITDSLAAVGGFPPDEEIRGLVAYVVGQVERSREEYARITEEVQTALPELLDVVTRTEEESS